MGQIATNHFQTELLAAVGMMRSRRFAAAERSLRALVAAILPSVAGDPLRAGGRIIVVLSTLFVLQLTQGKQRDADKTVLLVKELAWAADDFANTGNMTWWHTVTPAIACYGRPEASDANLELVLADLRVA
jgi:hypothetical protein